MEDQLLNSEETAERLRQVPSTLAYWRGRGEGPPWAKVGRRVVYRERDVQAWIDAQFEQAGAGPDTAA